MPRIITKRSSYTIPLPPDWEGIDWEKAALTVYPFDPIKTRLYNVFKSIALSCEKQKTEERPYLPPDIPEWEYVGERRESGGTHIILAQGKEWLCPCNRGEKCKGKEK